MINDRGTKKWTALMLPEQIEMFQKMWEENSRKETNIRRTTATGKRI